MLAVVVHRKTRAPSKRCEKIAQSIRGLRVVTAYNSLKHSDDSASKSVRDTLVKATTSARNRNLDLENLSVGTRVHGGKGRRKRFSKIQVRLVENRSMQLQHDVAKEKSSTRVSAIAKKPGLRSRGEVQAEKPPRKKSVQDILVSLSSRQPTQIMDAFKYLALKNPTDFVIKDKERSGLLAALLPLLLAPEEEIRCRSSVAIKRISGMTESNAADAVEEVCRKFNVSLIVQPRWEHTPLRAGDKLDLVVGLARVLNVPNGNRPIMLGSLEPETFSLTVEAPEARFSSGRHRTISFQEKEGLQDAVVSFSIEKVGSFPMEVNVYKNLHWIANSKFVAQIT